MENIYTSVFGLNLFVFSLTGCELDTASLSMSGLEKKALQISFHNTREHFFCSIDYFYPSPRCSKSNQAFHLAKRCTVAQPILFGTLHAVL